MIKDISEDIIETIFNRSKKGNCFDEEPTYHGFASYRQIAILTKKKRLIHLDSFGHILTSGRDYTFKGWKIKAIENARFNIRNV